MCNIYKNNLNTLLKIKENDSIYYENCTLHIEDRYLCQFRGHNNPNKVIDIFFNSYNNYYNHFIIPSKNKLTYDNKLCEVQVDINYFKNCIKGIKLYINNISYKNIDHNKYINKIEELEKTTIHNYLDEKTNYKKLIDSIGENKNYSLFNYFFTNKETLEGKIFVGDNKIINKKELNNNSSYNINDKINYNINTNNLETPNVEEDNIEEEIFYNNNSNDLDNLDNLDNLDSDETNSEFEDDNSFYDETNNNNEEYNYYNLRYIEGIIYILGRKFKNLFFGIGNHLRYIFFFKDH